MKTLIEQADDLNKMQLEFLYSRIKLIVLTFTTRQSQQEIFAKASEYFTGIVGLREVEREDCCVSFEDDKQLGYVNVTVSEKDGKSRVDLESKEYEYYSQKFVKDFK